MHIDGEKETPEEFAARCARVHAIIRANLEKSDFEIGLLCEPPLSAGTIANHRRELGCFRPRTTLKKRLSAKAT
jgi:hypothetical protein